ncbi:mitochondrial 37S ribosomal protein [Starmerella bacillaris]|uniref:Mitochondrial 37S ribosomal protein n=1 Tax=Starmerella bacillaris TaxID=1247836 RepID=A0AAV5RM00_STABA|nr:mitochondrial 37S ribosomal protein [Starmerella bacillaris]
MHAGFRQMSRLNLRVLNLFAARQSHVARFSTRSSQTPQASSIERLQLLEEAPLADWLLSLDGKTGKNKPANVLAEEWLQEISDLRKKHIQNGRVDVNKTFAPEGVEEYDFWQHARAQRAEELRSRNIDDVTPEMEAELEAVRSSEEKVEKRRFWMNMLTNHVMRDGKKGKAYNLLNRAMYLVFLKKRTDPAAALLAALDSMAPLVQLHKISDGGARVETVPVPYSAVKRIGKAWKWVLEASDKRQSRDFSVRLAEEIIAAIDGKSSGYEKCSVIHKAAIANRSVAEEVLRGKWK